MCAIALLLVGALVFLAVALGDPLELLERPTDSALRFADRRVLIDAALPGADSGSQRWIRLMDPWAGEVDKVAAAALLEEVRQFDGPSRDLLGCTAVMHAASGNLAAAQPIVNRLQSNAPALAAAIAAGWFEGSQARAGDEVWAGPAGQACRFALASAAADRAGDRVEVARLAQRRDAVATRLIARAATLSKVRVGLVALGLVVFFVWLVLPAGGRGTRVATALVEDAWPPALGTAVLVRGGFWAVIFTLLLFALGRPLETPLLQLTMPALLTALPLMGLVYHRLLRPQRCGFLKAFGLLPRPAGLARALLWTLPVFAFEQVGRLAIEHSSHALGLFRHWSEGFAEDFVWATGTVAITAVVNFVVWMPFSEEFAFRGVLYSTLRNRVIPVTATFLSAATFAGFHLAMTAFASLPLTTSIGLATAFWSGLVWAIAYEKTRSLLPGILAHLLTNLFAAAGSLALFG